jgi:hypothetical protein
VIVTESPACAHTRLITNLICIKANNAARRRFAGYYKGTQSIGAAVAWAIDSTSVSFHWELLLNWTLFTVSVPFTAAVVYGWVTNGEKVYKRAKQAPMVSLRQEIEEQS